MLRATWEAFFSTYGAHIQNQTNTLSDLEADGTFGKGGIIFEKGGRNVVIDYLAEKAITYSTSPTQLEKSLPNAFKIIDGLVKKVVSPNPIAESDVDKLITSSVSRERGTNGNQLSGWQQQAVDRNKQRLAQVDPDVLKKLAAKEVRIHFIDGLLIDHPVVQNIPDDRRSDDIYTNPNVLGVANYESQAIYHRILPLEFENEEEESRRAAASSGRISVFHEIGHIIDSLLGRPSQTAEFKKFRTDDRRAYASDRAFEKNNYPLKNDYEYFAQAVGFYLATYPTLEGGKSYNQILRERNP